MTDRQQRLLLQAGLSSRAVKHAIYNTLLCADPRQGMALDALYSTVRLPSALPFRIARHHRPGSNVGKTDPASAWA
jgi:hypothetical protein